MDTLISIDKITDKTLSINGGNPEHSEYGARIESGQLIIINGRTTVKRFSAPFETVLIDGINYINEDNCIAALSYIGNFKRGDGVTPETTPTLQEVTDEGAITNRNISIPIGTNNNHAINLGQLPGRLLTDNVSFVASETDVKANFNRRILQINGIYNTENFNVILPSADPTHTGLYPAFHYNKVEALGAFGVKFAVNGLSRVIPDGTTFNLLQLINLTDKVVFVGNRPIHQYVLDNEGTENALLKLPNINRYVTYNIDIRIVGTLAGAGIIDRQFSVQIRRSDNSIAVPRVIRIPSGSSFGNDGLSFTTASIGSADNYVVNGIKIIIDNPAIGSNDMTINGFEILINGNV